VNFQVTLFAFLLNELIQTSAIYSTKLFVVARGVKATLWYCQNFFRAE